MGKSSSESIKNILDQSMVTHDYPLNLKLLISPFSIPFVKKLGSQEYVRFPIQKVSDKQILLLSNIGIQDSMENMYARVRVLTLQLPRSH